MSKMEFVNPFKAEKFKKQKCVQFCGTPCIFIMEPYQASENPKGIHIEQTCVHSALFSVRPEKQVKVGRKGHWYLFMVHCCIIVAQCCAMRLSIKLTQK